ncbi:unnamed protein product [Caenorhabditis nigoni]
MVSLIEMPELVMENIIGFSDFKDVLTLRQVCRDFRNFIDDVDDSKLPDSKFEGISFKILDETTIGLSYEDEDDSYSTGYCGMNNFRCFSQNVTDLGNVNIVDVAIRDLEWLLKFQKSVLEEFDVSFDEYQLRNDSPFHSLPIKVRNMFEKLNRKIKTRKFTLKTYDESQIIAFLPFIDPEALKSLEFHSLDYDGEVEIEIDEIAKTEQWKNSEELDCEFRVLNLKVEDICHFSSINFQTNTISAKYLDSMKKVFIKSSKFELLFLGWEIFNENEELTNLWGPAFSTETAKLHWYFRMKDSEERILRIIIDNTGHLLWFDVCKMESIPNGAIVQDYNEK